MIIGSVASLWRRSAAALVAALLALQSALPMVAPAADSDAAAFWRELGVDLAAAICRNDGAGPAKSGGSGPAAPHDDHHSLLCKVLCGAGAPALAAAPPPVRPVAADAAALPAPAADPLPLRPASAAQPRAPPLIA